LATNNPGKSLFAEIAHFRVKQVSPFGNLDLATDDPSTDHLATDC
jgi:hypothetical protein